MFQKKAITKEKLLAPLIRENVIQQISGHPCFAKKIYISTDLEVFPCVMERRFSHGNLKEAPLKKLIKQEITKLSKDYICSCKDCEYRYACFDCRPDANGKALFEKPWYCSYDPYSGRFEDLKVLYHRFSSNASALDAY